MYHEEVEFSSLFIAVESVTLAILLTVVVVSFFVYFIEIQIILSFRNTSFKGPFYRLMFVGIIVDMISAVNLFTGQVIPAKVWFVSFLLENENWLGKVFYFITYGGRCIQGATATILSFCRVFAVCAPVLYRKLGEPCYINTMQGIQFFGAFVAAALLIPDRYEYFYENDGYYSVGSDEIHAEWFYNFAAILEVFFVLCIVVNNVVTYTTFHWRFGKKSIAQKPNPGSQSQLSRERQKRESSLDRMTFIVCCVELVYFAYVVYSLQINPYMNRRVFYYFYNILCVIYSTFSAWMLLLVSQPITIEFRQLFTKMGVPRRQTRSISISVQGSRDNNKS